MKKLIIALVLCLPLVVQGNEPNQIGDVNDMAITFRVLTEPVATRTNIEGWLGFRKGESELGLIVGWRDETEELEDSLNIGGFTMFHFPDVRELVGNSFWLAEWLPESITAEPAVGLAITYNLETSTVKTSPFVALRIYKTLEIQIAYDVFGNGESDVPDGTRIGLSTSWKF